MAIKTYTSRCLLKKLVAPGVYELMFEKPHGFSFLAGQFVLFDVPLISNPNDIQPRAYSIASAPHEATLLFVVKTKPGGRFSEWMEQVLTVGDTVTFKGPFGLFTVREGSESVYFIATGAGVAPFRSQILDLLERGDTRPLHLLFGVRTEEDLFWKEVFEETMKKYKNFTLHLCLSGASETWKGYRGRVSARLPEVVQSPCEIYICGAPEMVADIKKLAVETLGVEKKKVHAEGYI